ncbi:Zinc finger protein ZAT5 [Platanthera guangdongensis]|uniref:Zinc finger protein ZAT5 n=1 Tax=Platanthera guangdongensis TaxID=2320717 RepID=A0ABR2MK08_9ASPA
MSQKGKRLINLAEFGKKTTSIEEKGDFFYAYESPKWGKTEPKVESAYQCTSCSRSFHSYQALGGHRASHKRIKTCCLQNPSSSFDKAHESNVFDQLTVEMDVSGHSCQSSKNRIHKCSICEKIFSSGQAHE